MRYLLLLLLAPVVLLTVTSLLRADPLPVGTPAPKIKATDQNGKTVDFADVYAKGVTLVYFYPKAGTPGCTAEACSLRDAYTKLEAQGLQIVGVSRDGVEKQKQFKDQFNLPFTLIADPKGEVAAAFGVPKVMGVLPLDARQSFLVKDDKIVWNSPSAQTEKSAQEVQAALDRLK
jgi:peroxiredoxin Q/BCP